MSDRRIKVQIDQFGRPRIEAEGFSGEGCKEATANMEKALSGGNGAVNTVLKGEYYATETAGTEVEHQY